MMKHTHCINCASSVVLALSLLAACGIDTSGDTEAGGTSDVADKSPDDRGDVATATGPHDPGDTACQSIPGEGPWTRDLIEWRSSDGTHFTERRVFQVCADVPSIAQDGSGMIIAAFQAFEAERGKIGVRLSWDEGESWSPLTFIELMGPPDRERTLLRSDDHPQRQFKAVADVLLSELRPQRASRRHGLHSLSRVERRNHLHLRAGPPILR